MEDKQKVFIPDTNILVHAPHAISVLGDKGNTVVILFGVVRQLDNLKSRQDLAGYSAREAARQLKAYRKRANQLGVSLRTGIPLESGGTLFIDQIDFNNPLFKDLPLDPKHEVDDELICAAKEWRQKIKDPSVPIIVVSQDTEVLLKADALGVEAEDYEHDQAISSLDELYKGFVEIKIINPEFDFCTELYRERTLPADRVFKATGKIELSPNQCCFFQDNTGKTKALAIFKKQKNVFKAVDRPKKNDKVGPIDDEQALAYALLMDPEITLVTLVGKAGTGKTILSLMAGCQQLEKVYQQVLAMRPIIELGGKSLGWYPGTLEEKFQPWTEAIMDNFDFIEMILPKDLRSQEAPGQKLLQTNKLKMSPMIHARGRSLHHKFTYVDEVQNITPSVAKTLVTRVAVGSKMILAGDPEQIDDNYLHAVSNGLVYVVQRFKGQEVFGHMLLRDSKRSELAKLAAKLL